MCFQPQNIDLNTNNCEIRITYEVFNAMDQLVMKDLSFFQFEMKGHLGGDFIRGKIEYGEILEVDGRLGEGRGVGDIEGEKWDGGIDGGGEICGGGEGGEGGGWVKKWLWCLKKSN